MATSESEQIPKKLFIEGLDVRGKRVLVRVDFNVPLENGDGGPVITDDRRIVASLPTIRRLIDSGARVILMSHLGRPKGERKENLSLAPVATRLSELLEKDVPLASDCVGEEVASAVGRLGDGDVILLENLRFHADETKNGAEFARSLSSLGELYVNDAFGTSHRAHASTQGLTEYLDCCAAGYLLQREIEYLGGALSDPGRPFVAIVGGAKVSSKIVVIERLLERVDTLLIGGGMAYTFFKAMGREIGKSLFEDGQEDEVRRILDKAESMDGVELLLPVDCVVASEFSEQAETRVVGATEIPADLESLDIGPKTAELYGEKIAAAKTVVWNGPMGVFEMAPFAKGTNAVAEALVRATAAGATTIVGGGDSALAIQRGGYEDGVSHVSTGGGAALEFLEGKVLPALAALTDA